MVNVHHPIGPRLIRNIIMVSTFFSILATGIQLYSDYKGETYLMNIRLDQIKSSSLDSLTLNLWQNNETLINIQLKSLLSFPDITYAAIFEDESESYAFGENLRHDSIAKEYPLVYTYKKKKYTLGILHLQAGLGQIRDRLQDKFYLIAVTQSVKTFIVAFVMLYIFSYMVTRHLHKISQYARVMSYDKQEEVLQLDKEAKEDELDLLVDSLNSLHAKMRVRLSQSEQANSDLDHINEVLQKRIDLHKDSAETVFILKKEAQEILNMMKMIYEENPHASDIDAMKQDLKALNILLQRTLNKN